jgi:hypothetical protein
MATLVTEVSLHEGVQATLDEFGRLQRAGRLDA